MTHVWLVTGSSRGLGRALAETVLAAGDRARSRELAGLVERHGDHVRGFALDLTDPHAAGAAIAWLTRYSET